MYPKGCTKAFEALMQETPYSHYNAGHVSSIVPIGSICPAYLRNVLIPHICFPHGD